MKNFRNMQKWFMTYVPIENLQIPIFGMFMRFCLFGQFFYFKIVKCLININYLIYNLDRIFLNNSFVNKFELSNISFIKFKVIKL